MANEPIIKGTTVKVGLPNGVTVTGTVRDSVDDESTGNIEYAQDENNNDTTAIVTNLGRRYRIEFSCQSTIPALAKGDVVTINTAGYLVEDANIRYAKSMTRGTVTLYKPDAATWNAQ